MRSSESATLAFCANYRFTTRARFSVKRLFRFSGPSGDADPDIVAFKRRQESVAIDFSKSVADVSALLLCWKVESRRSSPTGNKILRDLSSTPPNEEIAVIATNNVVVTNRVTDFNIVLS